MTAGGRNMTGFFDRKSLIALFDELSEELAATRTRAQIYIVGGAVMALEHSRDRSTNDVDAHLGAGRHHVLEAAKKIAKRHGLGDDWLSEEVGPDLPRVADTTAPTVYKSRFLTIQGASPKHLLAMKLEACRDRDRDDIRVLLQKNRITTSKDAEAIHREMFPNRDLKPRARQLLDELTDKTQRRAR